jgi:hypothetical protein
LTVRQRLSSVGAAVIGAAIALVGNLATNTVPDSVAGWAPLLWAGRVALIVASIGFDVTRSRVDTAVVGACPDLTAALAVAPEVVGTTEPRRSTTTEDENGRGADGCGLYRIVKADLDGLQAPTPMPDDRQPRQPTEAHISWRASPLCDQGQQRGIPRASHRSIPHVPGEPA